MKNGRCRMHGGKSTGAPRGNVNRMTHGFFSNVVRPHERRLFEAAGAASIDDEIGVIRLQLYRLVKLSGGADIAGLVESAIDVTRKRGEEFDHATESMHSYNKLEITAKAPQYADLIIRTIDALRKLLLAQFAMAGNATTHDYELPRTS